MENLSKLRQEKGLTQKQLAKELNISNKAYWSYESNRTEPNIDTLKKISDYFHTTIDHIVGHEVPHQINKFKYTAEQLAVIEELESLDKEQCYMLLAYIDGLKTGKAKREKVLERFGGDAT